MKYFIILIIALSMVSCKKFLEEKPKDIASELFFTTAAEMESSVLAIWEPLQSNQAIFGRHYHTIHESQSDYGNGRGSYSPITNFQGLDATNIIRTSNMWTNFYLSIRNANLVIANEGRALANGIAVNTVEQLVAEAQFMRALNYFYLVRNWGGVPLRDENNMDELSVPRAPVAAVYQFIEQDLAYAEDKLPAQISIAGRANKYTAKAVLSDVFLFQQKWKEARDKSTEVINSGVYNLIEITTPEDYRKIFGYDVVSSEEEIFYIKFTGAQASNFTFMLHHPATPYYGGDGAYGLYTDSVKNSAIASWDKEDFRKTFNLYTFNIGVGSQTTQLYKKFIEPDRSLGLSSDYPIYRYAEILLINAEADAMMNNAPTANSLELVNMVNRRAYGYRTKNPSPVDFKLADYPTLDSFRRLIANERMYELFCEGKRFLDLKRMGLLEERIKLTHNKTVAEKQLLWPIPNVEFNFNDAIDEVKDQNPGY